jgi:hypothetical protein
MSAVARSRWLADALLFAFVIACLANFVRVGWLVVTDPHILGAVASSTVVARIASILETVAHVFTTVSHVLPAIADIFAAVAHVLDLVAPLDSWPGLLCASGCGTERKGCGQRGHGDTRCELERTHTSSSSFVVIADVSSAITREDGRRRAFVKRVTQRTPGRNALPR